MNRPPENLSQFWDLIRDELPFPAATRIFENALSSHPSWKAVMSGSVLSLANAAHMRRRGITVPRNAASESCLASKAAEHDFPMFWVNRSFLEAILRTDPPEDLPLSAIHWPFPALTFILPKGTLVHESDGDCSWLMIGKLSGSALCPLNGDVTVLGNATVMAMTAPWDNTEPPIFNYGINDDPNLTPFRSFPDYGPGTVEDYSSASAAPDISFTVSDQTLAETTLQLGLRLMLALTARPEYLEAITKGRSAKSKAGTPREYATPRWLGKDYHIPVSSGTPDLSDGHVRLHWRRGHFKNQPHGEGRSLRKLIWIEPYLAGK